MTRAQGRLPKLHILLLSQVKHPLLHYYVTDSIIMAVWPPNHLTLTSNFYIDHTSINH